MMNALASSGRAAPPLIAAIGRALVGVLFLVSGLLKVGKFAGCAAVLANKRLPLSDLVIARTVLVEVAGGWAPHYRLAHARAQTPWLSLATRFALRCWTPPVRASSAPSSSCRCW